MEVKMQTSFIPKKPITANQSSGSGVSIFLLLSIIIFITTTALAGVIWIWRGSLINRIEKDKQSLVAAKDSYEEGTITPLIRLNDRIEESKGLLARHLAISPVFLMLEKKILRNIRLKSMKFVYEADDKIRIDLSGVAASYDALLRQSDSFGSENLRKFISQPVISDFSPTTDGSISFSFNALVDPRLVDYENTIVGVQSNSVNNNDFSNTP